MGDHRLNLVRRDVADTEVVRNDPRPGAQAAQLRDQLGVDLAAHVDRNDAHTLQIHRQDVLLCDCDQVRYPLTAGVLPGLRDAERVQVVSDRAASITSGCGDEDASVPAAEVANHVVWGQASHFEHSIHHVLRGPDEFDEDQRRRILPFVFLRGYGDSP